MVRHRSAALVCGSINPQPVGEKMLSEQHDQHRALMGKVEFLDLGKSGLFEIPNLLMMVGTGFADNSLGAMVVQKHVVDQ